MGLVADQVYSELSKKCSQNAPVWIFQRSQTRPKMFPIDWQQQVFVSDDSSRTKPVLVTGSWNKINLASEETHFSYLAYDQKTRIGTKSGKRFDD